MVDEEPWMRFNALKLIIDGLGFLFHEHGMPVGRDEYESLLNYALELIDIIEAEVGFSEFEDKPS